MLCVNDRKEWSLLVMLLGFVVLFFFLFNLFPKFSLNVEPFEIQLWAVYILILLFIKRIIECTSCFKLWKYTLWVLSFLFFVHGLSKSSTSTQQNSDIWTDSLMLSALLWPQVQNTAPCKLLWRKLALSQLKLVQCLKRGGKVNRQRINLANRGGLLS